MFVKHMDCVAGMRLLADNSIDAVVTDPPYELGFMGKSWDSSGIANSVEMWGEALRVLKPGGHMLAFSGSRTYHRMACAIEDAGFEIRDQIMWVYGSGFPKSHNLKGEWDGWGTALKPAHEPICVARKPLIGTVSSNVLEHGTGALNIDGCRVAAYDGENRARPPRTPNAILGGGKGTNLTASEHNDLGRWPANLIHDGSDEVVSLFPSEARVDASNSAARFFYCAKASRKDRNEGCDHIEEKQLSHDGRVTPIDNAYQRNSSNSHPTVKPTELMRYLCRLVTPSGGTVLDPFAGSGSTGKAAVLEGFAFLGFDITAEYVEIANARITHALLTATVNK